ncbi:MAG TPA: tetratricopeptide repeat protein [bacterium]
MTVKNARQWFGLWAFLLAGPVAAGVVEQPFQEGNRHFQAGQYEEALAAYSKVLASGSESGPLYYNMGNCYYKLSDIGRAVLFYERAKRLMPRDGDVKANLALANLAAVDKIESQGDFFLIAWTNGFVRLLPRMLLVAVVLALYVLSLLMLTGWFVVRRQALRMMLLRLAIAGAAAFLLFGAALVSREREQRLRREAVILASKVDVQSAPGDEGVVVFSLHAGARVRTDQKTGEWVEIVLPDRKVGWVKQEVLEAI